MVSTQAGAIPPGLMTNLFRGFDVCLLVTAPMLLGVSPVWSFAIAAIAALVLLNSMDAESLRARQAQQQKLLDRGEEGPRGTPAEETLRRSAADRPAASASQTAVIVWLP